MSNFVTFWQQFLNLVADFLMEEPIVWFTASFVLLMIVGIVLRAIHAFR